MKVKRMTYLILILVTSLIIGRAPEITSAQQVRHKISNGTVTVTIGDLSINIVATSGISSITMLGKDLLINVGWQIFDPLNNLIATTYNLSYYELGYFTIESPTVTEVEGGLIVVASSRMSNPSLEVKTVFSIFSTGLIMINTTIRAYANTESGKIRFAMALPANVFKGQNTYFVSGVQETKVSLPSKYKVYTLYSGPLAIMYSSTKYGDLIVIANSPDEIDSVKLDDARKYGNNYYILKLEGLSLSGALVSGTSVSFSILIYVHNKGSDFTSRIVTIFKYLKDVYANIQSLSRKTPRTPGGRSALKECIQEYTAARKAFVKGDFDSAYSHALRAVDLIKKAQNIEIKQRILLYMVIPDIILLILILLSIKTSRDKVLKG